MFIGEYTSSAGYQHSATNQLIFNLKKGMDRRNQSQWRYKENAILQAAQTIEGVLTESALNEFTFVPIPPSRIRGDPAHDDRMLRIVQAIPPIEASGCPRVDYSNREHGCYARQRNQTQS